MAQRRKFSAEYKREAVAMLAAPGVSVSQIAAELGIGVTVLGRWRRDHDLPILPSRRRRSAFQNRELRQIPT